MKAFPMTVEGHAALMEELKHLKSVERPSIIAQIAEAREHGDLSENAEYHAAKEKQGFIEGRLKEVDGKLGNCQVIDVRTLSGDRVVFGATVTVLDHDTDDESTYIIVGDDQASKDLEKHVIGVSSPIARALISKSVGEELTIRTPKGKRECEVVKVAYIPREIPSVAA